MGEETEFDSESHYEEHRKVDTSYLDGMWAKFGSSLKTESRFINHSVRETLDGIFSGLESMRTGREKEVIVKAGGGRAIPVLYRAQWCRDHAELENMLINPDRELGPPPHHFSGANRMSARGISVLRRQLSCYCNPGDTSSGWLQRCICRIPHHPPSQIVKPSCTRGCLGTWQLF